MGAVAQSQIRRIYAIGNALGLVRRGTHDDELHGLVWSVAKKEGVTSLSAQEADEVIAALERLQGHSPTPSQPQRRGRCSYEEVPGGVTVAQQRKIWALMYQLQDLDVAPSATPLGSRLCGIIRKDLKQNATPEQPFAWLTFQAGHKLIEVLKKYVANAGKKRKGGDTGGAV